mmetsp:Transcript_18227/g.20968  ORF Transcript_18227/g.20968 Transcript_18227/m.20968 type:complete len:290 (+) Transcript_18227:1805-2674(+)
MEVSDLDSELLRENGFEIFDYMLHFTQSELQEEQRLATRGLAKLPLQVLKDRNPKIMPQLQESTHLVKLDSMSQNVDIELDQKIIHEDSYESSMSNKSDKKNEDSLSKENDLERQEVENSVSENHKNENKEENKNKTENEKEKEDNKSNSINSESDSEDSSSEKSMSMIGTKGSIHSFINSLATKLKPKTNSDSDIQYFSLYSIFNLLLQMNINSAETEKNEERDNIPMSQKSWNDLSIKDFNMMLINCNIVNNAISLLIKSKNEDIIRVSLKVIILVTFKVPMKNYEF